MDWIGRKIDGPARRAYVRLRQKSIAARLRLCLLLGLLVVPLGALSNLLVFTERLPERLAAFAGMFVLMAGTRALIDLPSVRRRIQGLAVTYISGLVVALVLLVSNSPEDLQVLAVPVSAVIVACPLLFPWGARHQLVVSLTGAASFFAVLWSSGPGATPTGSFSVAVSLGAMCIIAVFAAALLERHRQDTYVERRQMRRLAIQRRRILEMGRELRGTLDLEVLLPRLVAHARNIVPADRVTFACREPETELFSVAAAAGDRKAFDMVGFAWPIGFSAPLCEAFPPRDVRTAPGGPLDSILGTWLESEGVARVAIAAVGPHPMPMGFLSWERFDDRPFSLAERRAIQEIADQAHTALSAAHLYGRALESSRLKSEFVSTISHEFRTPLSVILGYAEMARDEDLDSFEHGEAIEGIENSARELLLIVEQTLDISRIEAGQSAIQTETIKWPTFWLAMQEMCGLLPQRPEVSLDWSGRVPAISIESDRRRLGVIIRNLVGNALKFTPHGSVNVAGEVVGEDLRIEVRDTGIGISPEDQAGIFEMFRQGDGSETRRYEGTGLGLYIVSQFVEQLGGTIELESEPGRGSCFRISLPMAGPHAGRTEAEPSLGGVAAWGGAGTEELSQGVSVRAGSDPR